MSRNAALQVLLILETTKTPIVTFNVIEMGVELSQ